MWWRHRKEWPRIRESEQGCLHRVTTALVRYCDGFMLEDLKVRHMTGKGEACKKGLNRSIREQQWDTFQTMLACKAERAGKPCIFVNPRPATQAYVSCGRCVPKTLTDRGHDCPQCGQSRARDYKAALHIPIAGLSR